MMKNNGIFEQSIRIHPVKRQGDLVGNYRLIGWLGRGAFADVYLGEHIYLRMQSAIKMLHVRLSEQAVKDFLNEACTIARLDHPNIVRILDYGVENGTPFLVMAYAPNGCLQQRFPQGMRLSLEQVVPLVQQMASALDYAHKQGVIHRDVKPENMLIGARDQVLLSDFGLVLVTQSMASQTANGLVGTALYMAPEMLEGKVHFASDQYALGIVTYQWLCGQCPFTGSFIQVGTQHLLTPPSSLCERVPGLHPSVEQVVFKALAKDRVQRYENVTAFANALQEASREAISTPSTHLSLQLPPALSKTSPASAENLPQAVEIPLEWAEALPPKAEVPTLSEAVRSPRPSRSAGKIWLIVLLVMALVAVVGSGTPLWYSAISSHVSTRSATPRTVRDISATQPPVQVSPIPTVNLPSQVTSTPALQTPQVISTPTPVVFHTITIDDSVMGTGPNQFNYVGSSWVHCTGGCNGSGGDCYDGSWTRDSITGEYVTVSFTGVQIQFYVVTGTYGGIGAISLDGGSETMVNFYSPSLLGNQLTWTSPMLPAGTHTFKLRVTGTKGDPNSRDSEVGVDRVDILTSGA